MKAVLLILVSAAVAWFGLWAFAPAAPQPISTQNETQTTQLTEPTFFLVTLDCNPQDRSEVSRVLNITDALCGKHSQVTLFLDLEAVSLASNDASLFTEDGRTILDNFFPRFQQKGGRVIICPTCARQLGLQPNSLRDGVRITSQAELQKIANRADQVFHPRLKTSRPAKTDTERDLST